MAKALTAKALTTFKPDPNKRREIPDGVLTGLYFIVQPTGGKSWAIRYRHHDKPRKLVLGKYLAGNDVEKAGEELKRIRRDAAEHLQRAQEGRDPASEKQTAKRRAKDENEAERTRFDHVTRDFLARHAKPNNRSWKETARTLGLVPDKAKPDQADDPRSFVAAKGGIVDKWGHRPISDIARAEIIALLDDIVEHGTRQDAKKQRPAPILANRTLAALRKLYNWAIGRDLLETSPCAGVQPPAAEKSRDRVLTDGEIKALWQGCEAIGWPFGPMVKMLLLTGQRREEVAGMMWREIDLENRTWAIPRARVKTDRPHDVPLNDAAAAILNDLPKVEGADFVFTTTGRTAASGISKAKERLDAKMRGALEGTAELPPWRLHDLRRTVASGMARIGINLPVIEKVLNHTSGSFGGIVSVYQRHSFADEKRRALIAWGSFVERLTTERPDNVINLKEPA